MKKKIIFTVLVMYLLCTLASPIVLAEEKSQQQAQIFGIFGTEISFEFTKNLTDEPISPLQTQEIGIKIKFKLEINSLLKRFFFNRRIGRLLLFGPSHMFRIIPLPKSNLTISISESPTWCTSKLDTELFEFSFKDINKNKSLSVEKTVKLEYIVNENATALEAGEIVILADFMGFWTIKGASNSTIIPVTAAYVPALLIEAVSELTIPPLKNTTIPINITNNGNGDSIISINCITPENWTVTLDPEILNLKVNEIGQITLTVNPPKEFDNQTINFSFIPRFTTGLYEGTPVITSINFINDGSLEEEGIHEGIIIGIIILVIIIILIVTYLFLKKKKQ